MRKTVFLLQHIKQRFIASSNPFDVKKMIFQLFNWKWYAHNEKYTRCQHIRQMICTFSERKFNWINHWAAKQLHHLNAPIFKKPYVQCWCDEFCLINHLSLSSKLLTINNYCFILQDSFFSLWERVFVNSIFILSFFYDQILYY